jgi:hypothetical protein
MADLPAAKPAQAQLLLRAALEVAAEMFGRLTPNFLGLVEADLFDQAEAETVYAKQNALLDARTLVKRRRAALAAPLQIAWLSRVKQHPLLRPASEGAAQPPKESRFTQTATLSLLDTSQLDIELIRKQGATRISALAEEELGLLTARIGELLGKPDLNAAQNPLGPLVYLEALDEALEREGLVGAERALVLKTCGGVNHQAIVDVYHDLNRALAEQGVLPELRAGFVARGQASPSPRMRPDAPPATLPLPFGGAPGAPLPGGPPLQPQGIGNSSGASGYATTLHAPLPFGSLPAFQVAASQLFSAAQVSTAPGRQQAVARSALFDALGAYLPSVDRLTAQFAQGAASWTEWRPGTSGGAGGAAGVPSIAGASPSILWEVRDSPAAKNLSDVDSLVIDVVAILFDYMFDDPVIPSPVKALIGRLQIPILKLAMADKSFFSHREHPARMLLDALAKAGVGCPLDADASDPVYAEIESAVEVIHDVPEPSVDHVNKVLQNFNAALAQVDRDAEAFIEQSRAVASERAERELARENAERVVDEHITDAVLPAAVRELLEDTWPQVMMRAFVAGGTESGEWQEATATVDDLVWSLQPKYAAEDRNRMLTILPGLLQRLQKGIDSIGIAPARRDQFFNVLVDCHSRAMEAGLNGTPPDAPESYQSWLKEADRNARSMAQRVPGLRQVRVSEQGVRIEEIRLSHRGRLTAPPDAGPLGLAEISVPPGAWVEFNMNGTQETPEIRRLKLTWTSPLDNILLFTNPQSAEALSISRDALAAQIVAGEASLLDLSPLSERAVGGVQSALSLSGALN